MQAKARTSSPKKRSKRADQAEGLAPLTLLLDRDRNPRKERRPAESFSDFAELLRQTQGYPAIVVLGGPGAGKTTMMEWVAARQTHVNGLRPFYVSLKTYGPEVPGHPMPLPLPWLGARWTETFGEETPSLQTCLEEGTVLLLLDAVNEIRVPDAVRVGIEIWGNFLRQLVSRYPGNRAVLTCRELNYSTTLTLDDTYVPTFRVQPIERGHLLDYIGKRRPELASQFARAAEHDPELFRLYRNPYFLRMLLETPADRSGFSSGRTQLFSRFVWELLFRELQKHPSTISPPLFTQHDCVRIAGSENFSPHVLPVEGFFIPFLTDRAYGEQDALDRPHPALAPSDDAPDSATSHPTLEWVQRALELACATGILEKELKEGKTSFYHQLLREFFAARRVAQEFDPVRWRSPWKTGEVEPIPRELENEQMPELKGNEWEETTIMAASFATDQQAFVSSVFEQNIVLAARCAASSGVKVDEPLAKAIQSALIERMRDEGADLRARIQAGLLVDDLTLLGFKFGGDSDRPCLLPPMVTVCSGEYPLGGKIAGAEGWRFHANVLTLSPHKRVLPDLTIGTYPVTNAEFALFIQDGGYEEDRWWESEEARRWRSGEGSAEGARWQMRVNLEIDREWGAHYLRKEIGRRWSAEEAEERIARLAWNREQHEAWLQHEFPSGVRLTSPGQWEEGRFNAPSQPVVRVSWFEASAYCKWLTAVSGCGYRLLTEFEYEVACGGKEKRAYSYGTRFDPQRCNVYRTRIWRPTPIGMFDNATPEGAYDLTGNVWTWTNSLELSSENPILTGERKVTRGGSYDTSAEFAMSTCRDSNHPGYRDRYVGFRMALQ